MIYEFQLRAQVRLGLGHEPTDEDWALARGAGWVERVGSRGNSDREVTELVRWIQKLEQRGSVQRPRTREVPGDRRAGALAEILALEAGQLPEVQDFRRRYLRRGLLGLERVAQWLERQSATGGPALRHVTVELDGHGRHGLPDRVTAKSLLPGVKLDAEALRYSVPGESRTRLVGVPREGALRELGDLCQRLEGLYSWSQPASVALVLAGVTPPHSAARVTLNLRRPFPARSTIRLDVNPRLPAGEVADLYKRARSGELFGDEHLGLKTGRVRSMSNEHAELAVFAAARNDGRSWEEVMKEWSREHPELGRTSVPAFTRAAREAYHGVTGQPLDWKRPRGRQPASAKSARQKRRK